MAQNHTPVEPYTIGGEKVYVKRDDLFMADRQPDCPPLAKLRGAYPMLERLKAMGYAKIAVYDTRVSKAGQGIAFICRELGLQCLVGFPQLKGGEPSKSQQIAGKLGAELYPLPAGRTAICHAQFAKAAKEQGYYMLPLGLVCRDTVENVAKEAASTVAGLRLGGIDIKAIVLSTGTGTIATGVHLGTKDTFIRVHGVSCGMAPSKQATRAKAIAYPDVINWDLLFLHEPAYEYYDELDISKCPFRTNPWYDMKAWVWLEEHIGELWRHVLFWNIGA